MPARDDAPLTGRLVVATPDLADENFDRAVVLILEHEAEGALGVILNRTRGIDVVSLLPAWHDLAASPAVLFSGGPVQPDEAVIGLGRSATPAQPVTANLGVIDLEHPPEEQADVTEVRLFTGYAGWGPGQLEEELETGSWFVVDPTAEDPLTADPDGLWRRVLLRQGGVFTTVTEDPSLN
ncbi:MAG: YqgE/AlgH family protein [Egibacteraceae bacterium]